MNARLARLVTSTYDCSFQALPSSFAVADIGADHGIVTQGILLKSNACHRVFTCDVSASALRGARELLANEPVAKNRVEFHEGNGLNPLLSLEPLPSLQACILAGMGPSTVAKILFNDDETSLYKRKDPKNSGASLDKLDVQRLIIQPWPPNIMSLHALHILLHPNWITGQQWIDRVGRYEYVTSVFHRSNNTSDPKFCENSPIASFLQCWPLARRLSSDICTSPDEKRAFLSYLRKQRQTLKSKVAGAEIRNFRQMSKNGEGNLNGDSKTEQTEAERKLYMNIAQEILEFIERTVIE